ncbi:MAG: endonuclease/exonuclease/phosphatase family protein [Parabacteroides sp.]|nr:endonuclease/exonuclease/phosphatase family protein [Parabacteroides sp.]
MVRILTMTFCMWALLSLPTQGQTGFRVMSYNVENLFDTEDDPLTADNDFLPSGNRHWTPGRLYHKLQQLAKVITAAGEWSTPALIGLCEVENDSVLARLLHATPLRRQHYRYCMTHGQDTRGINVALLYQRDQFRYLGHAEHPVRFARKQHKQTRNILHVWGEVITGDRLDVLVCHFPSRYGGEKESEPDRLDAARTLRTLCDSLHSLRPSPHILIMGDFNDTPDDTSIREILDARPFPIPCPSDSSSMPIRFQTDAGPSLRLYNLFAGNRPTPPGSHKYQGEWSQLDQIILSSSLADTASRMQLIPGSARIFSPPFLLITDKTWRGQRPFRTYHGFKYEGGYSDHLPLIVDFRLWK